MLYTFQVGVMNKVLICLLICLLVIVVLFTACQKSATTPAMPATLLVPLATSITAPAEPEATTATALAVPGATTTTAPVVAEVKPETPSMITAEATLGLHTTKARGEQRFVSVLVNFPDVKRTVSENFIRDRMTKVVSDYFMEVSYNNLVLKGDATKIYKLLNPVSAYRISPYNLEVDPERVISLVNDSVNAADADVNFSNYTYISIHLGATPMEYGMIGYCAVPGMLGWQEKQAIAAKSGEIIQNAAVYCENAHAGTYVHDFLHMLGGEVNGKRMTPCLYDHDLQLKNNSTEDWPKCLVNMGFWDPLSSHWPYNKDLPPAGLSSWTKLRLGWIDAQKIALIKKGETATVNLGPLTDGNSAKLVIKIPLTSTTYYLIENRQPVASDKNLPASGVLILYCNDAVEECRNGKTPVKLMDANPAVPYMNDAAYDIGKKTKYVDTQNNLAIILEKKDGLSYQIRVTTAN
jgi:M6 family metalloprotease-like protein